MNTEITLSLIALLTIAINILPKVMEYFAGGRNTKKEYYLIAIDNMQLTINRMDKEISNNLTRLKNQEDKIYSLEKKIDHYEQIMFENNLGRLILESEKTTKKVEQLAKIVEETKK